MDLTVPRTAPGAPTVDHVVPRARGGTSDPTNLRLAHRRCNGARGSDVPELDWPADLPLLDAAPLWDVAQRALRRPGQSEVVCAVADVAAADVVAFLQDALPDVLGGAWEVTVRDVGAQVRAVAVSCGGPVSPDRTPAARRAPAGRRGRPRPRGRRRRT